MDLATGCGDLQLFFILDSFILICLFDSLLLFAKDCYCYFPSVLLFVHALVLI